MKMRIARGSSFAVLLVLCLGALPQHGWGRVWKDRQGREVEADFVDLVGDNVRIKRTSDGHVFEYPLEQLSDEDQEFARRTMETGKSSAASPPAEKVSPASPAADADAASTPSTTAEPPLQAPPAADKEKLTHGEDEASHATAAAVEAQPPTSPSPAASPPPTAGPSGSPFTSPLAYAAYCIAAVAAVALVWFGVKLARRRGGPQAAVRCRRRRTGRQNSHWPPTSSPVVVHPSAAPWSRTRRARWHTLVRLNRRSSLRWTGCPSASRSRRAAKRPPCPTCPRHHTAIPRTWASAWSKAEVIAGKTAERSSPHG